MSIAAAAAARASRVALRRVGDGEDLRPAALMLYLPVLLAGALIFGAVIGFTATRLGEICPLRRVA